MIQFDQSAGPYHQFWSKKIVLLSLYLSPPNLTTKGLTETTALASMLRSTLSLTN